MIYILGIDESGTGSWAGPFTVCGVLWPRDAELKGLRSSKRLSDKRRRALVEPISDIAVVGKVAVVDVPRINAGHKTAWRWGVRQVITDVMAESSAQGKMIKIVVDGVVDKQLRREYSNISFQIRGDETVPAVQAASVIAKTVRNDLMIELGRVHKGYGFEKHAGYGTKDHRDALKRLGLCSAHRNIKTLKKYLNQGD